MKRPFLRTSERTFSPFTLFRTARSPILPDPDQSCGHIAGGGGGGGRSPLGSLDEHRPVDSPAVPAGPALMSHVAQRADNRLGCSTARRKARSYATEMAVEHTGERQRLTCNRCRLRRPPGKTAILLTSQRGSVPSLHSPAGRLSLRGLRRCLEGAQSEVVRAI